MRCPYELSLSECSMSYFKMLLLYIYIYIHGMDWLRADLENSSSFPLYALEIKCYAVF